MEELRFQITEETEDERIDKCMSLLVENLSRSFIQKLIKEGNVLVNGKPVKGSYRVKCDDEVVFSVPESVEPDIEPENIPLDILYEDADLIVVNKPKGMVVHPAAGHYTGTLVNALMYHCGNELSGINGVLRPGIVHRIDRDTTGSPAKMIKHTDALQSSSKSIPSTGDIVPSASGNWNRKRAPLISLSADIRMTGRRWRSIIRTENGR